MQPPRHHDPRLWLALLGTLAGFAGGCAARGPCGSGMHTPMKHPHTIHVVGVGEVEVEPDIARATLGVEARAAAAPDAANAVSAQMQKVIGALKQAGVEAADLQTHQLSLYLEHNAPPRPPRGELKPEMEAPREQYVARNQVEVVLRDLDRAPAVIAAATAAGANSMHGLNFDVEDRTPHVKQARERAVRAAQANAAQLAELNGVELGPVVSVFDGAEASGPGPMGGGMMRTMAAEAAPPVERGRMQVRHSVTLVVELAE